MAEYISLSALALDRKTQIAVLRRGLEVSGIRPAFNLGLNQARFYGRSIVQHYYDDSGNAISRLHNASPTVPHALTPEAIHSVDVTL